MNNNQIPSKLGKLASQVRTGGKGSVRRKKKAVHKTSGTDDKKLQSSLKRMGVNPIPQIDEANFFKEDGTILHFKNPKVQASIAAHTYVVSGASEPKKLQELLPGILNQLGSEGIEYLKKMAESYASEINKQKGEEKKEENQATQEQEEEIPPLVQNFDEVAQQ